MRTPVEPTVFPSVGHHYLIYELHLQNHSSDPLPIRGIEVFSADKAAQEPVAVFKDDRLDALLRPIGVDKLGEQRSLAAGQGAIAFLCLAFDGNAPVPSRLSHRVVLDNAVADGPVIGTRGSKLHVLSPPLEGTGWTADNGPSLDSHHRMGLFVAGGLAQISRRYAIDWKKYKQGATFAGDARDVHSYYAYGEKVLSVADGTVIAARDRLPDNIPRTPAGFTPAVALTMETVSGNSVVIDLGDGQFASYSHMQPGSVRVKVGDRVRRGQWLGRIGNSGDARWPHLHFQVTTTPDILASEGVPYLIDHYRVRVSGKEEARSREYPLGEMVIDFDPAHD